MARINFRPPESLKTRIEDDAARERMSVNAWLVRATSRSDTGSVRCKLEEQPGPDTFDVTAEVRAHTRDGDVLIRRARPSSRPNRMWRKR